MMKTDGNVERLRTFAVTDCQNITVKGFNKTARQD
jgi:hypothetical protein